MTEAANGSRIEKAANSALVIALARYVMAFGVPIAVAIGGWFASQMVIATNNNTAASIKLEERVTNLIEKHLPLVITTIERRIDAGERRNDVQDGKIDIIQQRIWQLPAARVQQPEEQQRQQWQQK